MLGGLFKLRLFPLFIAILDITGHAGWQYGKTVKLKMVNGNKAIFIFWSLFNVYSINALPDQVCSIGVSVEGSSFGDNVLTVLDPSYEDTSQTIGHLITDVRIRNSGIWANLSTVQNKLSDFFLLQISDSKMNCWQLDFPDSIFPNTFQPCMYLVT